MRGKGVSRGAAGARSGRYNDHGLGSERRGAGNAGRTRTAPCGEELFRRTRQRGGI